MSGFLIYNLKVGACLAIFYLFYKLVLSRDTFHRVNRVVLLFAMLVSFVLPLCRITLYRAMPVEVADETANMGEGVLLSPEVLLALQQQHAADSNPSPEAGIPWNSIIMYFFVIGAVIALAYTFTVLIRLIRIIRKGEHEPIDKYAVLVKKREKIAPFSWLRYIVISMSDLKDNAREIITHERAHIKMRHSYDLLLADICGCLQWFNPAMWLIKSELKSIHEYEADIEVLKSGVDPKEYQMLLIKKAVDPGRYSIANSLNHSNLKNRITMMLQKRSNSGAKAKILLALPLVCLCLTAFARTEYLPPEDKTTQKKVNIIIAKEGEDVNVVTLPETAGNVDRVVYSVTIDDAPLNFQWPAEGRIDNKFGPGAVKGKMHKAVDIALNTGDPVYAALDGVVIASENDKGYGNIIKLSHSNDMETRYAHLDSRLVKVGDQVKAGDVIGNGGSTGLSTGPHLHFEVLVNGRNIDPEIFRGPKVDNGVQLKISGIRNINDAADNGDVRMNIKGIGNVNDPSENGVVHYSFSIEDGVGHADMDALKEGMIIKLDSLMKAGGGENMTIHVRNISDSINNVVISIAGSEYSENNMSVSDFSGPSITEFRINVDSLVSSDGKIMPQVGGPRMEYYVNVDSLFDANPELRGKRKPVVISGSHRMEYYVDIDSLFAARPELREKIKGKPVVISGSRTTRGAGVAPKTKVTYFVDMKMNKKGQVMFDGASVPLDKVGEKLLDMSVKHNFLITECAVNVVADRATPYGYIEDLKEKLGELHVAKVSYVAK